MISIGQEVHRILDVRRKPKLSYAHKIRKRLSDEEIARGNVMRAAGATFGAIAKKLEVSDKVISEKITAKRGRVCAALTNAKIAKGKGLISKGMSVFRVAALLKCDRATVKKWCVNG